MGSFRDLGLAAVSSAGLYAGMVVAPESAAVLVWLVSLPGLLLVAVRPRGAVLWLILASLAIGLIADPIASVSFAVTLGVATWTIASGVARSWTVERTLASALAVWSVGVAALFVVNAGGLESAFSAASAQVDEAFAVALEASKAAGADKEALTLLEAERSTLVASVLQILPGLVVLTGGAILAVNVAIARRFVPLFDGFRLRYWRAPDALIWAFIATGFGMFVPLDAPSTIATNAFVVLLGCYFLQGLAVVAYYLERFGLPTSLRIGTYILIVIQQVLTALVLALGIFDLWGDFRRLHSGTADASFGSDGGD